MFKISQEHVSTFIAMRVYANMYHGGPSPPFDPKHFFAALKKFLESTSS